jgi:hypothetical protein
VITARHLEAALAVWQYSFESAGHIFGTALGDPEADDILRALRAAPDGLTRNDVARHFGGHRSSSRIGAALTLLQSQGLAYVQQEKTGGRPAERWFASDQCAKSVKSAKREKE